MSCCCNQTPPCAPFTDPVVPDLGQCFPYREQRDCEAPVLPVAECVDDTFTIEYDPDQTPMFRAISTLFDENCSPITDQTLADITTQSV